MDEKTLNLFKRWQQNYGGYQYFYHTDDKNAVLAWSHYSDPAFDGNGACIFGINQKGLTWDYADRLYQWDADKHDTAWTQAVEQHGNQRTAARIETYLSIYHGKRVELKCIISGTRQDNGYAWYAYGYIIVEQPSDVDAAV